MKDGTPATPYFAAYSPSLNPVKFLYFMSGLKIQGAKSGIGVETILSWGGGRRLCHVLAFSYPLFWKSGGAIAHPDHPVPTPVYRQTLSLSAAAIMNSS